MLAAAFHPPWFSNYRPPQAGRRGHSPARGKATAESVWMPFWDADDGRYPPSPGVKQANKLHQGYRGKPNILRTTGDRTQMLGCGAEVFTPAEAAR